MYKQKKFPITSRSSSVEKNIENVKAKFPFKGYMDTSHAPHAPYYTVANTLIKYLGKGDKILDFGSGPCDKTAIASDLGFNCSACDDLQDDWCKRKDNTQKILDFTKSMNIRFSFDLVDLLDDQYDLVMMNDVVEHLHNSPRELLNDLIQSIKPRGYLFITVPNLVNLRKRLDVLRGKTNLPRYELFYWYPSSWRGPVREYTRGDLEQMTEFMGLELVELKTVHHMLANLSPKLLPIYKIVTKVFPDLADTWSLVAQKPENWSKKEITEAEFAKIYQQKGRRVYT